MRLLILSALSREIRGILNSLDDRVPIPGLPFRASRVQHRFHEITFAETGMGVENAVRVFEHVAGITTPEVVISLGYCGGLVPGAAVGDLIWASAVCLIDGPQVEVLPISGQDLVFGKLSLSVPIRQGTFITLRQWMKKVDILPHVPAGMPLPVCEMETFGVARLAMERNVPFFAIRCLSDADQDEIAFDPSAMCDPSGSLRLARSLRFFASHSRLLGQAMKLRRASAIASRNLALATEKLLQTL